MPPAHAGMLIRADCGATELESGPLFWGLEGVEESVLVRQNPTEPPNNKAALTTHARKDNTSSPCQKDHEPLHTAIDGRITVVYPVVG
jgi:hypothetical protein